MTEKDKKMEVAVFRFGIISEFVTGVRLSYGEKEKLIKEKIGRIYKIPFSKNMKIARSTIEKWVLNYKNAGFRLEGLYPKNRSDLGKTRVLTTNLKLAIAELKKKYPHLKIPALVKQLRHEKLIEIGENISLVSIYRFLKNERLNSVNTEAADRRVFEAENPNDLWQSDVMHGPYVFVDGKVKKSYLIAIIDDYSRFVVHAEFYLSENILNFRDSLRQAVLLRGLPHSLYVDNGSCFRSLHLEQIAAQLGISLKHSRPYVPQGRGKIERWFRFVRDNFLEPVEKYKNKVKLDLLNHHFSEWVDEYNNRLHSTTKQTPYERYKLKLECVRPAPKDLLNYFRYIEFRRVKKDRSVRLNNLLLEVPVGLIDRLVELRFHPENMSEVEVYFQGRSYGIANHINPHINATVGRNWILPKKNKTEKSPELINNQITTGELFAGKEDDHA